ncbi:Non-specific lipid-transfer protein-like protein [Apostasia shenzhenica]|uniref:Non-specific lipid-transfer protein-like protein n=1 Tax=Apostasia shenzhenica TaxID=1088818 RepID=A0A2I0A8C9_9ASPA|nr:Non-specific lipid-transfer protein-like protein [Apostasia shenzhenica]
MAILHPAPPPATAFRLAAAVICTAFVLTPTSPADATANPAAPPPGAEYDCIDESVDVAPCLTFIENVSTLARPAEDCCPGLATAARASPVCFCRLLDGRPILGVEINAKKALNLPATCGFRPPAVSPCTAGRYAGRFCRSDLIRSLPISSSPDPPRRVGVSPFVVEIRGFSERGSSDSSTEPMLVAPLLSATNGVGSSGRRAWAPRFL